MFANLLSYIFLIGSSLSTNTSETHNSSEIPYIACVNEDQISSNISVNDSLSLYSFNQDYKFDTVTIDSDHPTKTKNLLDEHISIREAKNITFHTPGNYLCLYTSPQTLANTTPMKWHVWHVLDNTTVKKGFSQSFHPLGKLFWYILSAGGVCILSFLILLPISLEKEERENTDLVKAALKGMRYEHLYQKDHLYDPPARSFCGIFCEWLEIPCQKNHYQGPHQETRIWIRPIKYHSSYTDTYELQLIIPYPKDAQQKILQAVGYDTYFPQQDGLFSHEQYYLRIKDFTPPNRNIEASTLDTSIQPLNTSKERTGETLLTVDTPTPASFPKHKSLDPCRKYFEKKRTIESEWLSYLKNKKRHRRILPLPKNLSPQQKKNLHQALAFDETFYNQFVGAIDVIIQDEPKAETENKQPLRKFPLTSLI